MALANYAAYKTAVAESGGDFPFTKGITNASGTSLKLLSGWIDAPETGTTPTTAATCTAGTVGALVTHPRLTTTTNPLYLVGADFGSSYAAGVTHLLIDRLAHQGGLSGTSTTSQTTNLPTAALPRYTSGGGVMAAIEIYAAVGSTATTLTASYTNQAGTSGRTTKDLVFGGNGNLAARLFLPLPLQDGDTGVQSVESVTLAASTATAGNFGVTLFKPLLLVPGGHAFGSGQQPTHWDGLVCGGQKMIEVEDDACLQLLALVAGSGLGTPVFTGSLTVIEVA